MGYSLDTVAGPRGFSIKSPTSLLSAGCPAAPNLLCSCAYYSSMQETNILHCFGDNKPKSMTGEKSVSYRDYINEQRKLVQTKKEAREAKEDRLRNLRPPRLDPPPPRG